MSRRFFRHGELPLVLLALLAERPRHGYDVMRELTRLFSPPYRPSPGTVYPALSALAGEGLIAPLAESSGASSKVPYATTDSGLTTLDERRLDLAAFEYRVGVTIERDGGLQPVLTRFSARLMRLDGMVDVSEVEALLDATADAVERHAPPHRHHDRRTR